MITCTEKLFCRTLQAVIKDFQGRYSIDQARITFFDQTLQFMYFLNIQTLRSHLNIQYIMYITFLNSFYVYGTLY